MQKTKLGIGVGLMGAIICFVGFYSGILALIVLGGYVFLKEDNEWLKKTCVKVLVISLAFSIATTVLGLIPSGFGLITDLVALVNVSVRFSFINNLVYLLQDILSLLQKLVFLALGFKALNEGTIAIPFVDKLIEKYMA